MDRPPLFICPKPRKSYATYAQVLRIDFCNFLKKLLTCYKCTLIIVSVRQTDTKQVRYRKG